MRMTFRPCRKGKEIFPNTQHRAGRISGKTTFKLKIMEFKTERETVNSEITINLNIKN